MSQSIFSIFILPLGSYSRIEVVNLSTEIDIESCHHKCFPLHYGRISVSNFFYAFFPNLPSPSYSRMVVVVSGSEKIMNAAITHIFQIINDTNSER